MGLRVEKSEIGDKVRGGGENGRGRTGLHSLGDETGAIEGGGTQDRRYLVRIEVRWEGGRGKRDRSGGENGSRGKRGRVV